MLLIFSKCRGIASWSLSNPLSLATKGTKDTKVLNEVGDRIHSSALKQRLFCVFCAFLWLNVGRILNGLSLGEASRTILFAALRCQFLQYAVNPQDNLFELFQFARLFFARQDRGCNFAA